MTSRLTDKKIVKNLWLILAFVFPFFAVEFLRVSNEAAGVHVAIPMFIMGVILMAVLIILLMRGSIPKRFVFENNLWEFLLFLICLFFLGHLLGLIRAEDQVWAIREATKLALGIISFLCVVTFFPSKLRFIRKFWVIVIWTTVILLIFLIYQYAFVFKAPYLGSQLYQQDRTARNQLTWYLILVFPYAISYFLYSRKKLIICVLLPILIFAIALIYAASRGAWLFAVVGIVALAFTMNKVSKKGNFKKIVTFVLLMGLFMLVSWWILVRFLNISDFDFRQRFAILFHPPEEGSSYAERLSLLREGWHYFWTTPILGIGLTNSAFFLGSVTHNDYLAVFLELGFISGICFVGILMTIGKIIGWRHIPYHEPQNMLWVLLASRAAFIALCASLFLINAYTTLLFWIFLGLALVTAENERRLRRGF